MQRPSLTAPTLVLAAVGLVVASTTAGYAGGKITGADIRNGSIGSADLKNGAVKIGDLDPSLRASASIGKAYAFVTRVETDAGVVHKLDTKRTSGFTKLSPGTDDGEPVTGIWCLTPARGVDLSRSAIQVSTDYAQSAGVGIDALWSSTSFSCGAKDVEIHTVKWTNDEEPSPSDDVAFQVFAP